MAAEEKGAIKAVLLEHAAMTLRHDVRTVAPVWLAWAWRGAVSFASVLVMFVGTAYAAQDSLPGESLYLMKVHVVEEMIALTMIDPAERAAYNLTLMEARLNDLKILGAQNESPAPETVAVVANQIDEHVTDLTNTLWSADVSEVAHQEKLEVLSKAATIVRAQTKVAEQANKLAVATGTLADVNDDTVDAIAATVDAFAKAESPAVVNDYLSEQMNAVGDDMEMHLVDVVTQERVEQHLQDVSESLIEGDVSEAIVSVLEAQQEISATEYSQQELIPTP